MIVVVYHDHRLELEGHAETDCLSVCLSAGLFGLVVCLSVVLRFLQLRDDSMRHRWGVVCVCVCIGGECRLRSACPVYRYTCPFDPLYP